MRWAIAVFVVAAIHGCAANEPMDMSSLVFGDVVVLDAMTGASDGGATPIGYDVTLVDSSQSPPDATTDDHDAATACQDNDQDGHAAIQCGGDDCNDGSPSIFRGAAERCNAMDNNCDGLIDFAALAGAGDCVQQYPGVLASNRTNVRCLVRVAAGRPSQSAQCEATVTPRNDLECWRDKRFVACGQ